ncbi:MAG: hypothetical protein KDJ36_15835 [Hyphomicrobiaceae bacterium]|nr:hypothetical protein [Hyphomicrobiaceae bacterium]
MSKTRIEPNPQQEVEDFEGYGRKIEKPWTSFVFAKAEILLPQRLFARLSASRKRLLSQ